MIHGHHIYEDTYLHSFYGRNSSCAARRGQAFEIKGAPSIAKGWLSQGDYNKLIHMFKACTQSNAAGAK